MAEGHISVKQVKSGIGTTPKHRGTLRALGLGRIGRTVVLPDRPEIRGMVARVTHLVEVAPYQGAHPSEPHESRGSLSESPRSSARSGSTRPRRRVGRGIAGKGGKTAGPAPRATGPAAEEARFRGWPAAPEPTDPQAEGLQEPFPGRVRGGKPGDSRPGSSEVDPESWRRRAGGQKGLVKVLGRGELTRRCQRVRHAFRPRPRPPSRPRAVRCRSCRHPSVTADRPPGATRSPVGSRELLGLGTDNDFRGH